MAILRNREDAEEAAQEALLRSWRRLTQCRADDPRPWARQISRNEALRIAARRAKRSVEVPTEVMPEGSCVDHELERLPASETLRGALRQISASDRLMMQLRYGEDLTQPQLADLFGMPEGTVKIRLHRARAKMRSLLEADAELAHA